MKTGFLKNYTSDVPVPQTIARIEQVLIKCGVSGITKEYGATPGEIIALIFTIKFETDKAVSIRLPADRKKAQQALWMNYVDGDALTSDGTQIIYNSYKKKQRRDFEAQGERTAWKLVQDWIEVQMSLIQLNQAEFQQVFLPYVWDGRQTIYEKVKASGYAALLPERAESNPREQ